MSKTQVTQEQLAAIKAKPFDQLTGEEQEILLGDAAAKKAAKQNGLRETYSSMRDSLIVGLLTRAEKLSADMTAFKTQAIAELDTFAEIMKEYSGRADNADDKGNFTIESPDGLAKIIFSNNEKSKFNELSIEAEKHIMLFINSEFGDKPAAKIITTLLERTKGSLDIKLIQRLYKMENDYQDENWKRGIELLKESWQPTDVASYVRFYKRPTKQDKYTLVNLNFSAA
ncbi:Protein of unknown function [Flexibacter flexilis DSM 6793]|uniref:DUF3164 family protein n=1 Tax=Flexibacter flexilis DSM 6793 TaxID=927664 RepID=A0A1I1E184_9BACT|nr:DUF3164 family protein [Flexibacter flexilis]SFB80827.1 Protein of unknown function [Flexibacter flexilis DSM 6793]